MAQLAPELIANIGGFPVTNTVVATILVDIVLLALLILVTRKISLVPNKLQNATETVLFYFYSMGKSMAHDRIKTIFPWVMTFFLFILFSNILGLMPGIGSITASPPKEHQVADTPHTSNETHHEKSSSESRDDANTPEHQASLVRPATSDFNATLALGAISIIVTHLLSIRFTGLKDYLSRFFVINPILLFVGLLELVSEFIKIFSLSLRLFGNIYAGEVVLATISGLFAFIAPLPFIFLETIVAVVQALVFAMLTLVFMSVFTEKHHGEAH